MAGALLSLITRALDLLHDHLNLAVVCRDAKHFTIGRGRNFSDVAQARADVKHWRTDRHYVVDLAGMDKTDKRITHNHDVQIRRRKRSGKLIQGLVGKASDVGKAGTLKR